MPALQNTIAFFLAHLCLLHAADPSISDEVVLLQHPTKALSKGSDLQRASIRAHSVFVVGPVFERFRKNTSHLLQATSLVEHISISAQKKASSAGCSCTWNPSYPCEINGACWSYSTASSCEGAGGAFCGSSSGAPTCTCTWNPSYPCSLKGSCWGYTTKAGCEGAGGDFCGDETPTPAPTPAPTPPPTPAPPPSPTPSTMQAALDQHNTWRQLHQAPPLTWDASLEAQAQSWANNCEWKHSTMGNGENLWAGYGAAFDAASAVTDWYNELYNPGYDFNNPGFSSGTGHFTQVVWKSTKKVGCALKVCSTLAPLGWSNANFFVCEYSPPGNYQGEFAANVLPAKS